MDFDNYYNKIFKLSFRIIHPFFNEKVLEILDFNTKWKNYFETPEIEINLKGLQFKGRYSSNEKVSLYDCFILLEPSTSKKIYESITLVLESLIPHALYNDTPKNPYNELTNIDDVLIKIGEITIDTPNEEFAEQELAKINNSFISLVYKKGIYWVLRDISVIKAYNKGKLIKEIMKIQIF